MKILAPAHVSLSRLVVASAGVVVFAGSLYRARDWFTSWSTVAVVSALAGATAIIVVALAVALRGNAAVVKRTAAEVVFLGMAVVVAETVLLLRSPESWSDNPRIQRMVGQERAARRADLAYDSRLRGDVVRQLESRGVAAAPGVAQSVAMHPAALAAARDRGLVPLANASDAYIVECNEGTGYLEFRTDEHGFNNPRGLATADVDIAVIGESLAVGHCVASTESVVARIRDRHAGTANFGLAGSRVLAQLGVFREYVEPLQPPVVLWFINTGYAEARDEARHPILSSYLDPSFSQRLKERQAEVDAFVGEVFVPLALAEDEELRAELQRSKRFPLVRLLKLRETRRLVANRIESRPPVPQADLSHFEQALELMQGAVNEWGGELIAVVLPSYADFAKDPADVARYDAVRARLDAAEVEVVDGVALFAAQQDYFELFTLGVDGHPSARGHALLADALLASIERARL